MAETTFFVEPDGNLTRALQRKFPKLTIQEIERRKIPDVLRLNPDITNPNIVQAGIPYYVTDEERTFSRYPTDRVSDYAQANVSKSASDRITEMNRLSLLSDAKWAAEINAERAKTDKVGGLYTAFTGNRYTRSSLVTSNANFSMGDYVEHKLFGKGKILAIEGEGGTAKLTILFSGNVRKKIIAKYANLIPLQTP